MNIVDTITSAEDCNVGKGVSDDCIKEVEKKLHLNFAVDYRLYLEKLGIAAVHGHELTGISLDSRTNVLNVTVDMKSRDHVSPIGRDWYVLENIGMDDLVIWQTPSGKIYQESPGKIMILCESLSEYITKF